MKHARVLGFCGLSLLLALASPAWAHELKLGNGTGTLNQEIPIPLTLTAQGNVQGFVAAFDWDGAKLQGLDLVTAAALANADTVVPRIDAGFAVLGVVMDSDGKDSEIIAAGENIPLATLKVKALGPSGSVNEIVPIVFKDDTYATVDLGPELDNIIVIGGQSIGLQEGLILTNGEVTLTPPPPGTFTIVSQAGFFGDAIDVPVRLACDSDVQGFVMVVENGAGATLAAVKASGVVVTAGPGKNCDFFQAEIYPTAGSLAVVMELDGIPPFNKIPAGDAEVATFTYTSPGITSEAQCDDTATIPLAFVDLTDRDPPLENVIVIAGQSRTPAKVGGQISLSANPNEPPCKIIPPSEMTFAIGDCVQVTDHIEGHPGEKIQIGLYYMSPDDEESDETQQTDHIQGISMALCYDPAFIRCLETYSLAGTITETVGAEFVNVHCENDLTDGDGASLVVGILVDALPPFDGQTLPSSEEYLKLICVDFEIAANAPCDECSPITFCEANGRGKVPIRNLASVRNRSVIPNLVNSEVCILATAVFIRGDCNFAELDSIMFNPGTSPSGWYEVDIADAASVISFLFLTGVDHFDPPCLDACDANDDGRIDLADAVFILQYLFKMGKEPKPPFPDPGTDPTPDRLDCDAGSFCL